MESKKEVTEDSMKFMDDSLESTEENGLSDVLIKRLEPHHLLVLNTSRSCSVEFGDQKLFLHGLDKKLPRHIISFDERHLIRCLKLINEHVSGVSLGSFSSKMGILSHNLNSQGNSNMIGLVAGAENIVLNSIGDGIVGAITHSKSMVNILKSPLLVKLGSLDFDVNSGKTNLLDISDSPSYLGDFNTSSSQNLQFERTVGYKYNGYQSIPEQRSLVPISSTNSTSSDQSSSETTAISQGMLQITWKNGLPHYVFSTDGKDEVYVADLLKVNSTEDKFLDYVYIFHSGSSIVGRMTVSNSCTLDSNKSQILERQFVLYGCGDGFVDDTQTSSHALRKNKRLAKRVADVFRTVHMYKQRSVYKFSGANAIHEENPGMESDSGIASDAETVFIPNLELAAVVVRDHVYNSPKKAETGGWGLKFLKKSRTGQKNASLEASIHSECPSFSSGECSTSMDVVVPAGFHGGPRTRNGGPSSLLERWSSGGHCECGGWDVGCPLTVLNTRPNKTDAFSETRLSEDCKTIDLFIQGSRESVPIMKMANIHDGLYYIHFQSTLLSLQAFAIATAIIHSRSPILRSKLYRK
ncbi:PREDICTED: uncharacterized protein LOC109175677 [Ipomoea nil]|uniref:uncharacterized protein LOC109175677 n=1 Tax=Ipomoea nil TaxID=35883 RepID=UPI000901E828|nr:PREDICTED: uncharacterized protein LOC109175677 [Ipomoea nil]XP_019180543.1 PREDICTED: uncharacterized protein LOC109175677 [Ipomoea nil]